VKRTEEPALDGDLAISFRLGEGEEERRGEERRSIRRPSAATVYT